jgi:hypothetical protein
MVNTRNSQYNNQARNN